LRESRREEAASRPRLPFEDDLAGAFLEALWEALAGDELNRMMVETAKAIRPRERNFRVIRLFLA
jgi:hypothetical protein